MKQQSENRGEGLCEHHRRALDDGQWFYPFGSGAVTEAHRRATDEGSVGRDEVAPPVHDETMHQASFSMDGLVPGVWEPVQGQLSSYREDE